MTVLFTTPLLVPLNHSTDCSVHSLLRTQISKSSWPSRSTSTTPQRLMVHDVHRYATTSLENLFMPLTPSTKKSCMKTQECFLRTRLWGEVTNFFHARVKLERSKCTQSRRLRRG